MTTSIYSFLPQVLPFVAMCPDIVAAEAVRNAAIQLCERSGVWRVDLDPMDAVAGDSEYELDLPTGSALHSLHSATFNGVPLTPTTVMALDGTLVQWRDQTGTPTMFYRGNDDVTINLVYTPNESLASALRITAQLKPSRKAISVEDFIFERYLEDIACGALAQLLKMPGAWNNPQLAAKYEMDFAIACNGHRAALFSDYANVRLRARSPYPFR